VKPPEVRSPRLFLRELGEKDLPFLTRLLADPEVMAWWPKPLTPEEARDWLDRQRQRYVRDGLGYMLAAEAFGGRPVGQAGLMKVDVAGKSEWGLGYILAKSEWGRGYAVEICSALLLHAFSTLGLSRVVALIRPGNEPSERVARRLGMRRVRVVEYHGLPHAVYSRGPAWPRLRCSEAAVRVALDVRHGHVFKSAQGPARALRRRQPGVSEEQARREIDRGGLILEEAIRLLAPRDAAELEAFRRSKPNGPGARVMAAHERGLIKLFPGCEKGAARAALNFGIFYNII
jgi:ribosomal-protein-alanine N-acetyltransferase